MRCVTLNRRWAVKRGMLTVSLVTLFAAAGCRGAGALRDPSPAAPFVPPADLSVPSSLDTAPKSSHRSGPPVTLTDPSIRRAQLNEADDDDDDDDDGMAPPGPAGRSTGSGRPSLSPVENREGPFDEGEGNPRRNDGGSKSGEGGARPGEDGSDEVNDDGFVSPDVLMKAFGLDEARTRVYGWVEGGVLFNPANPPNHQNLPSTSSDLANRWQFEQIYLVFQRSMQEVDSFDYGYRFDNLFGTDWALYTDNTRSSNAFNSQSYGYTPTQYYGEVHLPILAKGGIDLRFGRFLSLAGYESAFAPGRPLRSTGFLFNYAHPFTHVGLLTTINLSDRLQVFNAPINGWDRSLSRLDQWGYMGGINWDSLDERTNVTLAYYAGPNQISLSPSGGSSSRPPGPPAALGGGPVLASGPGGVAATRGGLSGSSPTVLVSGVLSHAWNKRWTTVIEADYGQQRDIPLIGGMPAVRNSSWYGAGFWLLYAFNEQWTGVFRTDIFRDEGGLRTGFNDLYSETTLGLAYKPRPWLWIRPEIDYYGAAGAPPFATPRGRSNNELSYGFDVVFLF